MTSDEFRRSFRVPFHNSLGLAVYSCGVQRCGSCHSWGPAVRDHYLIHYVVSGKGIFSCGGTEYHLSAGDGFLVVPSKVVYYAADRENPWEYCWVGFNGSDAKRLMGQTGLLDRSPVFHYDDDALFEELLTKVCNASGSKPSDEARMESGLLIFLAALMDQFGSPPEQHPGGFEYVQKAIQLFQRYRYYRYRFQRRHQPQPSIPAVYAAYFHAAERISDALPYQQGVRTAGKQRPVRGRSGLFGGFFRSIILFTGI